MSYFDQNYKKLFVFVILINIPFIFEKLNKLDSDYLEKLLNEIHETFEKEEIDVKANAQHFNENQNYFKNICQEIKKENNFKNNDLILDLHSNNLQIVEILAIEKIEISYSIDISESYLNFCSQYFKLLDDNFKSHNEKNYFTEYEKIQLRIYIEEIINSFGDNNQIAIQYLNNISNFFGLKEDSVMLNEISLLIIRTLLNLILKPFTPNPHKQTFYNSLIVQLNKNSKILNSVTKDQIEIIFPNISNYNISSIENFSNFFVFFIPNIYFNFNFSLFSNLLSNTSINKLKSNFFVNMTFDKLNAIATKSKLEEILKENIKLFKFLPNEFLESDKPKWKFVPGQQFYFDTELIIENIQTKKEYPQWTEKFESTGNEFAYVFCSCLFYARSKTLSHLRETINFFTEALKTIINSKDRQYMLLNALFDVWKQSPVYIKFTIENLLNKSIIDHSHLITYIFDHLIISSITSSKTEENLNQILQKFLYFELLNFSFQNADKSLKRLRTSLTKEQENLIRSEESSGTEIIKHIEDLELNIEKLNKTCETLALDVIINYINFYNVVLSVSDSKSIQAQYVIERIINLGRNHKIAIMKNFDKLKKSNENEEIYSIINNFKNL